jgi:hypothetical protein
MKMTIRRELMASGHILLLYTSAMARGQGPTRFSLAMDIPAPDIASLKWYSARFRPLVQFVVAPLSTPTLV